MSISNFIENLVRPIVLKNDTDNELFREYQKSIIDIPYCGDPDFTVLESFVFKHNVRINLQFFRKACASAEIVFIEEDN